MRAIATIALLTFHEAVRRRLFLAVSILTPLIVGLTGWGFSRLPTLKDSNGQPLPHAEIVLNEAIFVILVAYMFSVVLAIGAAFMAAPAVASDVDSGIALAILPRPLRRSDFLLGKWLGLVLLLIGYGVIAAALELGAVRLVTGYVPPHPVAAAAYILGQGVVVLTISLLGSTRLAPMTCGIIAVVLFGVAWIAGIAEQIGEKFHNTAITNAGTIMSLLLPTDGIWRGAVYNLEPTVVLAADVRENPFSTQAPPTTAYLIWAGGWLIAVLVLANISFARRDL